MKNKLEIFKFKELFNIYESNLYEFINNKKYQPVTKLIKLKNNILKKHGVYLIFDNRIVQKKNRDPFKNLIYIGQAGGAIQKKLRSGETFFDRIHKHWLVTVGADKFFGPKSYSGISGSAKWRNYRNKKTKEIIYKNDFNLIKNHEHLLIHLMPMPNNTIDDKIKIQMLEDFFIYKFNKVYGHIPVCNFKRPKKNNIDFFEKYQKLNFK